MITLDSECRSLSKHQFWIVCEERCYVCVIFVLGTLPIYISDLNYEGTTHIESIFRN